MITFPLIVSPELKNKNGDDSKYLIFLILDSKTFEFFFTEINNLFLWATTKEFL